jgi:hypothetical protein
LSVFRFVEVPRDCLPSSRSNSPDSCHIRPVEFGAGRTDDGRVRHDEVHLNFEIIASKKLRKRKNFENVKKVRKTRKKIRKKWKFSEKPHKTWKFS